MGSFPYLRNVAQFEPGDKVFANRDTREGVMCCEPAHIGKVGTIVSASKMGKDVTYQLEFDGRIDYADHCTLSGLECV